MPNMYFQDGLSTKQFKVADVGETAESVRIASILSLFFPGKKQLYFESNIFTKQRLLPMSNKFHQNALTEYSRSYARRVSADFYSTHNVINGKQILNLTPISQINLLVVSSLFDKWKADAEKFRSPYFDFSHPEVEEALRLFMNVVSQHIAVRRENLEPMLADAVKKTLILIFDPRNYFDDQLRSQPDFRLSLDAARQLTRYTQINKFVPATIEQRMNGKDFVYVNQALMHLDEVLAQRGHELEKPEKYIAALSEKVPVDLSTLIRSYDPDSPLLGQPTRSFFEAAEETHIPPSSSYEAPERDQPIPYTNGIPLGSSPLQPSYDREPLLNGDSDLSFRPAEPPSPVMQPSPLSDSSYGSDVPAILKTEAAEPTSVAEAFHRSPIESIAKSISLNQKFRFINQLFNGQTSAYEQAINELDKVGNYGQALDLISYRYASQFMWDMSSDEVGELVEILKRRFA